MKEKECKDCSYSFKCISYGTTPENCNIYALEQRRNKLMADIKKSKNPDNFNNFSIVKVLNCSNCHYGKFNNNNNFVCKNLLTRKTILRLFSPGICKRFKLKKEEFQSAIKDYKNTGSIVPLLSDSNSEQIKRLNENSHKRGWQNVPLQFVSLKIEKNLENFNKSLLKISSLSEYIKHLADIANFAAMGIYSCKNNLTEGELKNDN